MSTPDLFASLKHRIVRALLVLAVAAAGIAATPAHAAEPKDAPRTNKLALSAPTAPRAIALVDTPRAATDDTPAKKAGGTSWLPWIVLAVGAAAVGGAIFLANGGKDPACPSGRVCQ